MVRWMEKNGLDVTYITNIDTHANAGNFAAGKHKAFLTAGHDEYYSYEMRHNLETARNRPANDQPLNLGFFSSNDCYWQIRFEKSSANGTNPPNADNRTIVAYKEHYKDDSFGDENWWNDSYTTPVLDDNHKITNKWRENRLHQQTCPGGGTDCYKNPEDELTGVMTDFPNFIDGTGDFKMHDDCPAWLKAGTTDTEFAYLVGNEPAKLITEYLNRSTFKVSESTATNSKTNATGLANAVYYKMNTGGRVFASGTNYWSWGIEAFPAGSDRNYVVPNGWSIDMYNPQFETMTMNILNCFKFGGADCGE